jgi:hypothetical protein
MDNGFWRSHFYSVGEEVSLCERRVTLIPEVLRAHTFTVLIGHHARELVCFHDCRTSIERRR